MPRQTVNHRSLVDLAVEGLQEERSACVRRLQQIMADHEHGREVEGYLSRIDNINQALVRLAGAHFVH
jgi:hypothetical protein